MHDIKTPNILTVESLMNSEQASAGTLATKQEKIGASLPIHLEILLQRLKKSFYTKRNEKATNTNIFQTAT